MPVVLLLLALVVTQADAAEVVPSALAVAIAQAQGAPVEVVLSPTIQVNKPGWLVRWSRSVGDSGTEHCRSTFSAAGALTSLDCTLEYVTHSMGPENARVVLRAIRTYDDTGALKTVTGRSTSRRLSDGRQLENRKISSATDERLGDLSKPLLTLAESLRQPR